MPLLLIPGPSVHPILTARYERLNPAVVCLPSTTEDKVGDHGVRFKEQVCIKGSSGHDILQRVLQPSSCILDLSTRNLSFSGTAHVSSALTLVTALPLFCIYVTTMGSRAFQNSNSS